jgi:hypothetical protein
MHPGLRLTGALGLQILAVVDPGHGVIPGFLLVLPEIDPIFCGGLNLLHLCRGRHRAFCFRCRSCGALVCRPRARDVTLIGPLRVAQVSHLTPTFQQILLADTAHLRADALPRHDRAGTAHRVL